MTTNRLYSISLVKVNIGFLLIQTRELIAEIELLEQEVANREQQVLSLYRSVFEECVSRPSSEQSSGMTSPAHNKVESRKHPSIISSTFCSSKKFPLRTFQALAAINDLGKRNLLQSKSRHASFYNSKADAHIQRSCSEHAKVSNSCSAYWIIPFRIVKIWHLGLTQTQKLAHEGTIA